MLRLLCLCVLFFCIQNSIAQTDSTTTKRKLKDIISFQGYVKYLQIVSFTGVDNLLTNNLIHNRLNFKAFLTNKLTLGLEARNRFYYGEQVRLTPGYGQQINAYNSKIDLSALLVNSGSVVLHTMLDRAYVDYTTNKFNIRVGRQRINWGINSLWNANDLFNTYNFVDFDYEERPGADAVKVQYFTGPMSSIEVAVKPDELLSNTVAAALYRFNAKGYDWQFLSGIFNEDFAIGTGFAGNIKNSGFKGEATYFQPRLTDTVNGTLNLSLGWDYTLKGSWYLSSGFLYNTSGASNSTNLSQFSGNLTAKNLMPNKYTLFLQGSKGITPLINASMALMYGLDMNFLFTMPSISYSLQDNWDLYFVMQSVFASVNNNFGVVSHSMFLRLKWSF